MWIVLVVIVDCVDCVILGTSGVCIDHRSGLEMSQRGVTVTRQVCVHLQHYYVIKALQRGARPCVLLG